MKKHPVPLKAIIIDVVSEPCNHVDRDEIRPHLCRNDISSDWTRQDG